MHLPNQEDANIPDLLNRLKGLEDEIAKSFEQVRTRLELLEAKEFGATYSEPDILKSQSALDLSSTRTLERAKGLASAAKERNCSAIVHELDKFAVEALPLTREHDLFEKAYHVFLRMCSFIFLLVGMLLFVLWGAIKFLTPVESQGTASAFAEVVHETKRWNDGELQSPKLLCVGNTPEGFEVKATHDIIPEGNLNQKETVSLAIVAKDVQIRSSVSKNAKCLTSQPHITGSFGDPLYKFITIDVFAPGNLSLRHPTAALLVESRVGGFASVNESLYFSFYEDAWTGVEVLMNRVVVVEGDRLGLSRLMPELYESLYGQEDIGLYSHYSRMAKSTNSRYLETNQSHIASFYIKAAMSERVNTYTPYGLLQLIMDSGGLWVGLSMFTAASVLSIFFVGRAIANMKCKARRIPEEDSHVTEIEVRELALEEKDAPPPQVNEDKNGKRPNVFGAPLIPDICESKLEELENCEGHHLEVRPSMQKQGSGRRSARV